MLPFHDAIGEQASEVDSLHVLARGLGQHYGILSTLRRVITSDKLVIGMNISRPFVDTVIRPAVTATGNPLLLPRHLTSDYSIRDRSAVYETPGFIILTSNVLVHDLLHGTLPTDRVGGLIIFDADRIREQSNEHFSLTLFRKKNKTAFIKAFSENPSALVRGFHAVEKLMTLLFVSSLILWPRFHQRVKSSLSMHTPDLIDLSVRATSKMVAILSSLRDTVLAICNDLRIATRALDLSEIYTQTTDDTKGLVHNFDDVIHRQLEGAETRYTSRVRSLLQDLKTLRTLIKHIFTLNSVEYYRSIVTIRATATHGANWLVRREAQPALLIARSRVWQLRKLKTSTAQASKAEKGSTEKDLIHPGTGAVTVPYLEASPKWHALRAVLREIQRDVETAGADADVARVLLLVNDQLMVDELSLVLCNGNSDFLNERFRKTFPGVAARASRERSVQVTMTQIWQSDSERKSPERRSSERKVQSRKIRIQKKTRPDTHCDGENAREELRRVFREIHAGNSTRIELLLWCTEWVDRQGRGHRVLEEYHPAFVIQYNADLTFIRQVEVYKASNPGRPVRLYILAFDNAVEEDRFREASGREKTAFKTLIRERATMMIVVNQEGRQDEDFDLNVLNQTKNQDFRSARGLGADRDSRLLTSQQHKSKKSLVLVDTRELRSSLPMLLYKSSITILPLTLEVGDFILSKNIGIERKSVPDLYGSFASGRLFNQAEALCRHYKYPCLLLELDPSRPLSLSSTSGGVPAELTSASIVSKMVLLLQQFSSLRLLWTKGPHDAAEMFASLKVNEEEPDEGVAASLGVDTKLSEEETFNVGPKSLLRSLPGIDSHNLVAVMRKVRNVVSLVTMSKQELTDVLGSPAKAALLHNFVNEQPSEAMAAVV